MRMLRQLAFNFIAAVLPPNSWNARVQSHLAARRFSQLADAVQDGGLTVGSSEDTGCASGWRSW